MGVQVEESAVPSPTAAGLPRDDGFAEFAAAGTEVSGEFRCADCGYGAVVHRALPACPMCGGAIWRSHGPLTPRLGD